MALLPPASFSPNRHSPHGTTILIAREKFMYHNVTHGWVLPISLSHYTPPLPNAYPSTTAPTSRAKKITIHTISSSSRFIQIPCGVFFYVSFWRGSRWPDCPSDARSRSWSSVAYASCCCLAHARTSASVPQTAPSQMSACQPDVPNGPHPSVTIQITSSCLMGRLAPPAWFAPT